MKKYIITVYLTGEVDPCYFLYDAEDAVHAMEQYTDDPHVLPELTDALDCEELTSKKKMWAATLNEWQRVVREELKQL